MVEEAYCFVNLDLIDAYDFSLTGRSLCIWLKLISTCMGIAECIGQGWFNIFDIKQNIFGIFFYFQLALAILFPAWAETEPEVT